MDDLSSLLDSLDAGSDDMLAISEVINKRLANVTLDEIVEKLRIIMVMSGGSEEITHVKNFITTRVEKFDKLFHTAREDPDISKRLVATANINAYYFGLTEQIDMITEINNALPPGRSIAVIRREAARDSRQPNTKRQKVNCSVCGLPYHPPPPRER